MTARRGFLAWAHESAMVGLVLVASAPGTGCSKKKDALTEPTPALAPSRTSVADALEDTPSRPRPMKIDHELTASRRSRVEEKFPETRGFLVEADLEEQMKGNKKIDRRERALEAFDELAKDRWVLFVGPMLNLDAEGCEMALAFIPESRRDKMAVTRLWFNVAISKIKGHQPVLLKDGQETAMLAKYLGNERASPAYDLVGLGLW
jgi:hypothetical protein